MKRKITILSLLIVLVAGMQVMGYSLILPMHPFSYFKSPTSTTICAAQEPPIPLWTSSYGSSAGDDRGMYVIQCRDGGFAVTGYSDAYSAGGDNDAVLYKANANGDFVWGHVYGGTDNDQGMAVVECSDGGFAIAGITETTTFGSTNMWLIKTDSSGTEQWSRNYVRDERTGEGSAIVQCSDGGFALAGWTFTGGLSVSQAWLVRTDSSGIMQWDQVYGGSSFDYFRELVLCSGGGFALAGHSYDASTGYDFYLVRTDSSGNLQWEQTFHNNGHDHCNSLIECIGGGFALAGDTVPTNQDYWLVRTDASGNKLWDRAYGDSGDDDNGYGVVQCWDGGFAIAGYTDGWHTSYDFLLIRTDANGNTIWEQAYGSTANDYCREIKLCSDGSYALVGYSYSTGEVQAWLMRIPSIINPGLPTNLLLIIGGVVIIVVVVVVVVFFVLRRRRAPVDTGV